MNSPQDIKELGGGKPYITCCVWALGSAKYFFPGTAIDHYLVIKEMLLSFGRKSSQLVHPITAPFSLASPDCVCLAL